MFLCGSSVSCSFNVNLGSQIMQATCVITSRAWSYLAGTDERGGGHVALTQEPRVTVPKNVTSLEPHNNEKQINVCIFLFFYLFIFCTLCMQVWQFYRFS